MDLTGPVQFGLTGQVKNGPYWTWPTWTNWTSQKWTLLDLTNLDLLHQSKMDLSGPIIP